jgi:hypothetical protein
MRMRTCRFMSQAVVCTQESSESECSEEEGEAAALAEALPANAGEAAKLASKQPARRSRAARASGRENAQPMEGGA